LTVPTEAARRAFAARAAALSMITVSVARRTCDVPLHTETLIMPVGVGLGICRVQFRAERNARRTYAIRPGARDAPGPDSPQRWHRRAGNAVIAAGKNRAPQSDS